MSASGPPPDDRLRSKFAPERTRSRPGNPLIARVGGRARGGAGRARAPARGCRGRGSRRAARRGRAGVGQDHAARGRPVAGRRLHLPVDPGRRVRVASRPRRAAGAADARSATCWTRCPSRRPRRWRTALGWSPPGPPADRFLVGGGDPLPAGGGRGARAGPGARRRPAVAGPGVRGRDPLRRPPAGPRRRRLRAPARTGSVPPSSCRGIPVLPLGGLSAGERRRARSRGTAADAVRRAAGRRARRATRWPCWRSSQRLDGAQRVGRRPAARPVAGRRPAAAATTRRSLAELSADAWRASCCWRSSRAPQRPRVAATLAAERQRSRRRAGRGARARRAGPARARAAASGTRCCAPPCCGWPRPPSSERRTRRWPTRCPPAARRGPGTGPSPATGTDDALADELARLADADRRPAGLRRRLRRAGARRPAHRRPATWPPSGWPRPPTTPSWPATSPAPARLVDRVLAGARRRRPRRGAVHARDAGAVRRLGPPVGRAPGRRLPTCSTARRWSGR